MQFYLSYYIYFPYVIGSLTAVDLKLPFWVIWGWNKIKLKIKTEWAI